MASYKFYLFDNNTNSETYIFLRLAENKRTHKFYTDLRIKPKDWNKEGYARKSYTGYSDFNSLLRERQETLRQLHQQLLREKNFSIERLRLLFYQQFGKVVKEDTSKKNFEYISDFAKHFLETANTSIDGGQKTYGTQRHYKRSLALFVEFETLKKRRITFEDIDLDFYHSYMDFLTKKKNFAPNTIGRHIKTFKLFLNEATERGINKNFRYKSKRFKAVSEQVESIYLSEMELEKIYNHDFNGNKRLQQARDLFILGCWTGLRFSDFSRLKLENIINEDIKTRTEKTNCNVVIPIHPMIRGILKKYENTAKGLPKSITNQKMNEYLKEIGEKAEINDRIIYTSIKGGLKTQKTIFKYEKIVTHTARRSFATNLFLSGFPAIAIMKITGHKTERAFMSYIRITPQENAKLLRIHWDAQYNKLKIA